MAPSTAPIANDAILGDTPTGWFGSEITSLNLLDDLGGGGLMLSKQATHPPKVSSIQDPLNGWATPGATDLFGLHFTEGSPAADRISGLEQLSTPSEHQELLSGGGSHDMMYLGQEFEELAGADTFLKPSGSLLGPDPARKSSAVSSLMLFGEKMERRVSAMGVFLSDPRNIIEDCPEMEPMSMSTENPVAVVLMCTKEFIEIIQDLTRAPQSPVSNSSDHDYLVLPTAASSTDEVKQLSTETTLLVLSSYLALMRLYDSLFRDVYRTLSQMPSETIKSIKLKSVFRIGGISSLQDMSAKAYAHGIVDVIQSHIQTMERCMGLPAAYCLSGEANPSQLTKGIFATEDRARLLHTVMAQDDVSSQGGDKSYVESIRENMKNSLAVFGN
ncbi:hypothetical protein diail_11356 [Diaporthe ilicicola]|nr:hypothetical protein diail_11356 [Diaporthe ilicicola]